MCGISIRLGKIWKWWTRLASVVALASGSAAMAAPTVLDFEDIAASTTSSEQYGPRGVIFQNAFLRTDPAAHSGTRVLQVAQTTSDHEFDPGPMVITFTSEQRRVKLFAGTTVAGINHTLKAFDANGALLAQDGFRVVTAGAFTTPFEVQVNGNLITRVEFLL